MSGRSLGAIKRLVVKMGSRVILSDAFDDLVDEMASLACSGVEVAVVSSGAVAMGMRCLGLDLRPKTLKRVQALAALGQAELIG